MTQNDPDKARSSNGGGHNAPDATYANHLTVDIDLAEARLNFGQLFDASDPPRVTARLVTSPVHLERFRTIISESCDEYEREYGDGKKVVTPEDEV